MVIHCGLSSWSVRMLLKRKVMSSLDVVRRNSPSFIILRSKESVLYV